MNEENKQAEKFEYCNLYLVDSVGPVNGNSAYFVLSQSDKKVVLLHPFTLTKFSISNLKFQESLMPTDPISKEKLVSLLTIKRDSFMASKRKAPYVDIEEIIKYYSS